MRVWVRGSLGVLSLAFLAAQTYAGGEPLAPGPRFADDTEALKRAEGLFLGVCGGYCHGIAQGKREAPYLFDCEWEHGNRDEDLFAVISDGVPTTRMIGFSGKLPGGDDDIWRLIAFLRFKTKCEE